MALVSRLTAITFAISRGTAFVSEIIPSNFMDWEKTIVEIKSSVISGNFFMKEILKRILNSLPNFYPPILICIPP
jgi:hypothetical protein